METKQTILVAPLNWGLGHATRCVPIIRQCMNEGHSVILAGSGSSLEFLKSEFPQLPFEELKETPIRYSTKRRLFFNLLLQMPRFGYSWLNEYIHLKRLQKKWNLTRVISDNRYGLWNPMTNNIIITHQLFIRLPKPFRWMEFLLHGFTRRLLSRFDECWVPDYENMNESLSGALSHGKKTPKNVKYIGPLSRFQKYNETIPPQRAYNIPDVLVLISGPEPFRSYFQKQMETRFAQSSEKVLLVCGRPDHDLSNQSSLLKTVSHMPTPEFYWLLKFTPRIITLAGYSTLMDLHALNRQAELIATPGQTEQEYLVEWWNKHHLSKS